MATENDFTYTRGDSIPINITVTSSGGGPVDITGATFLLTVDPSQTPTDAANNEFQSTGTIVEPLAGTVTFPISTTNSDLLGEKYYDIQMTDSGGIKSTIGKGKITFVQDITKT